MRAWIVCLLRSLDGIGHRSNLSPLLQLPSWRTGGSRSWHIHGRKRIPIFPMSVLPILGIATPLYEIQKKKKSKTFRRFQNPLFYLKTFLSPPFSYHHQHSKTYCILICQSLLQISETQLKQNKTGIFDLPNSEFQRMDPVSGMAECQHGQRFLSLPLSISHHN